MTKTIEEMITVMQAAEGKPMSKRIYLYTATWCGPCQQIKQALEDLPGAIRQCVKIYDADTDADDFISAGVRGVPTMIITDGGMEIARHTSAPAAIRALRHHLSGDEC